MDRVNLLKEFQAPPAGTVLIIRQQQLVDFGLYVSGRCDCRERRTRPDQKIDVS